MLKVGVLQASFNIELILSNKNEKERLGLELIRSFQRIGV